MHVLLSSKLPLFSLRSINFTLYMPDCSLRLELSENKTHEAIGLYQADEFLVVSSFISKKIAVSQDLDVIAIHLARLANHRSRTHAISSVSDSNAALSRLFRCLFSATWFKSASKPFAPQIAMRLSVYEDRKPAAILMRSWCSITL